MSHLQFPDDTDLSKLDLIRDDRDCEHCGGFLQVHHTKRRYVWSKAGAVVDPAKAREPGGQKRGIRSRATITKTTMPPCSLRAMPRPRHPRSRRRPSYPERLAQNRTSAFHIRLFGTTVITPPPAGSRPLLSQEPHLLSRGSDVLGKQCPPFHQ
jgi:hypothetical protein